MKDLKIYTFDQCIDDIGLTRDAWSRVRSAPKEEYAQAIRRELYWPEGFLEQLKGKPLEAQMAYYRIVEEAHYSRTAYGEITKANMTRFGYALEDYRGLTGLIVDDGILIGVRMKSFRHSDSCGTPAFPYQDICTYYSSDNNGSGYNDRDDYTHLCCVLPEEA